MKWFGLILLVSLSACTGRMCTEIGCVDGLIINFELEESTTAQVTLIGTGNQTEIECGGVQTECSVMEVFDEFVVTKIEVNLYQDSTLIQSYEQSISYEEFQPNGKGCDPVCNQASVTIID